MEENEQKTYSNHHYNTENEHHIIIRNGQEEQHMIEECSEETHGHNSEVTFGRYRKKRSE